MSYTAWLNAFDLATSDTDCCVATLVPFVPSLAVFLGLYCLLTGECTFDRGLFTAVLVGTAVLAALALCYVGRRLSVYRGILARPLAVWGEITSSCRRRGRQRIRYTYRWQGRRYAGRCALAPTDRVRAALRAGAPLALLVDRRHPQHSLVPGVYR